MRTLAKIVGSAFLFTLFTTLFTLGSTMEVKAQPAPLMAINTTPCPIWVQGQTGIGLVPGCMTAWFMVPPGGAIAIPPCAPGPGPAWYHVNYTTCMPVGACPIGMTNSAAAICGMPPVVIPNPCGPGPMFAPVWAGQVSVTF